MPEHWAYYSPEKKKKRKFKKYKKGYERKWGNVHKIK
jgi:hypothetical protein